ncbi:MAG: histidinol-phosphatase HisJ family protein [Firmicutes bacterium]|nr:histidinol-phosphatase HisJ family protein [Bacillota bacterium]
MKLEANYHTHTALCGHAVKMSEDYIKEAIRQGFQEIGFSDHGPIPRYFMDNDTYLANNLDRQMSELDFVNIYLPDLDTSINKYKDKIKILKGLEIEYLPGNDNYYKFLLNKLDYLSLGVHFFPTNGEIYNTYETMNETQIMDYAYSVSDALDTGFFSILNHPDLYLMNYSYEKPFLFDDAAKKAATIIIKSAIKNNVYLEINGGGTRKGKYEINNKKLYLYPRYDFWKVVESYPKALIIFGCDTHNPKELYDSIIEETLDFAELFSFHLSTKIDFENHKIKIK